MGIYNPQKHISTFYMLLIPIIIISKVVRYTLMYRQLVSMSIGFPMVQRINMGKIIPFHASMFSTSSASSVATSNAEALCYALNFFMHLTSYYAWEVFFTVVFNILVAWLVTDFYKRTPKISVWTNIFIYTAVAMLNIFALNMSKEPYQMLFFILMAVFIKKGTTYKMKCVWLTFALGITVLFCRKYYGLVFIYFAVFQTLIQQLFPESSDDTPKQRIQKTVRGLFIMFLVIAIFQHLFMGFLSAESESTYNEMMTMSHRDQNRASVAQSEIVPFFGTGNPFLVTIDYVLKIFRLLFPIELIIKGKITYFFLVAFQFVLSYFIFRAFMKRTDVSRETKEGELEENEEDEEDITEEIEEDEEEDDNEEDDEEDEDIETYETQDRIDNRTIGLFLYLAFLLCSAAFEPDFGSWARHESVTLPILLLIL